LFCSPSWWESVCVTLLPPPHHHPRSRHHSIQSTLEAIYMWAGRVQSKQFPILCVCVCKAQQQSAKTRITVPPPPLLQPPHPI
jgi:hypothetical protein